MASTTTPRERAAVRAMYGGLALSVLALVLAFAGRGLLADHVRSGYPELSPGEIDAAVTTYVVILATIGVLAIAGWLVAIRATRAGRRWARWYASGMLVAAAVVALTGLTVQDTSGEVGLAPVLGWAGLLPVLAGVAAVALMWRRAPAPAVPA